MDSEGSKSHGRQNLQPKQTRKNQSRLWRIPKRFCLWERGSAHNSVQARGASFPHHPLSYFYLSSRTHRICGLRRLLSGLHSLWLYLTFELQWWRCWSILASKKNNSNSTSSQQTQSTTIITSGQLLRQRQHKNFRAPLPTQLWRNDIGPWLIKAAGSINTPRGIDWNRAQFWNGRTSCVLDIAMVYIFWTRLVSFFSIPAQDSVSRSKMIIRRF